MRLAARPGRDILEREPSVRRQHATHLAVEAITVGDIHGRILRPYEIEARVGKRHGERVTLAIGHLVGEPGALREHFRERDEFLGEIKAGHSAAERAREVARGPADAAADVEHALGAGDSGELSQPYRRVAPA